MSRTIPPAALAAIFVVSAVVGCDAADGRRAATVPDTIAVGGVLDVFPTAPATLDAPVSSTSEPDRTTVRPNRTTTTTTTTTQVPRTSLTFTLFDIVDAADDPETGPTDRLTDDTGRLSMDLPIGWAQRSTRTGRLPDGTAAPYLAASADMRRFLDGYDAAGLTAVVLSGEDDLEAAIESYRFEEDCRPGAAQPYLGARVEGEFRVFRDCGGTDTDILTVVATPPGDVGIVLLLAQIRGLADLVAVDTALDSMTVSGD